MSRDGVRVCRAAAVVVAAGSMGLMSGGRARAAVNLLANPGAESGTGVDPGTVVGWTVGGTSNPGRDDGAFDGFTPPDGAYDFYGGSGASGTLSQTVSLTAAGFTAAQLDSGTLTATVGFLERSLDQGTPSDSAGVTLTFLDGGSNPLATDATPVVYNLDGFDPEGGSFAVPVGARSVTYTMDFVRQVGSDLDSFIDDNSLTVSAVPEPAVATVAAAGLIGGGLGRRRRRR